LILTAAWPAEKAIISTGAPLHRLASKKRATRSPDGLSIMSGASPLIEQGLRDDRELPPVSMGHPT
jgi:hypothetical protein